MYRQVCVSGRVTAFLHAKCMHYKRARAPARHRTRGSIFDLRETITNDEHAHEHDGRHAAHIDRGGNLI